MKVRLYAAILAASTALVSPAFAQAPASAASVEAGARNGWGFAAGDLTPDPAVRMGVLTNGMRYAIRQNATPKGGLVARMKIGVGWMYETPQERGIAHFLEHLVLNETQNFREGDLIKRLETRGLKFRRRHQRLHDLP